MALDHTESKSIVVAAKSEDKPRAKPVVNVLDEDAYVENLEKIITKDFFPDLPKLQAQAEFLDAVERKDTQKIWELQRRFSRKRTVANTPSIYSTPSSFDTPDSKKTSSPARNSENAELEAGPTHNPEPNSQPTAVENLSKTSLDKFLAKNTSEDNMSFKDIMEEAEKKRRLKDAWLFEKVDQQLEEQKQNLALPSIEQQAIEPAESGAQTWTYVPKNAVMYFPEGVPETAEEKIKKAGSAREIVHQNTRFPENPFNSDKSKESITQAASAQARVLPGRIGPDGKEILPTQSPRVGGFGFVATPSPAPGVDASPLMTWGEIEGTPFRLDGSDTPLVGGAQGPMFKIPEVPRRDRLLHELAEKASKAHRAKKESALKQVAASFSSPSPKFGSSKTDRLQFLSPAAQSLASKKLGIRTNTDKALRASYTPSPSHRTPADKTPVITDSPAGQTTTPTRKTPKRQAKEQTAASLTDNLLNLPKRAKAQEFF